MSFWEIEYLRRELEEGFPAEFRVLKGEREARWIGLVRPKLLLAPPEVTVIVTGEDVGDDGRFIIFFFSLIDF